MTFKSKEPAIALPFTADVCAHAIVAAAHALGDDPVHAMTMTRGQGRRSVAPAAWAVHRATLAPVENVAQAFAVNPAMLRRAASGCGPMFIRATEAARGRLQRIAADAARCARGEYRNDEAA